MVENGDYGTVVLVGLIISAVAGALAWLLHAWLTKFDISKQQWLHPTLRTPVEEPEQARCERKILVKRRSITAVMGAAAFVLAITYLLVLFKLGKKPRDGIEINWLYFAGLAITYALVGVVAAMYYWIKDGLHVIACSGFLAIAMICLSTGQLPGSHDQRWVLFGISVVLQAVFVLFITRWPDWKGPMWTLRGWFAAAPMLVAFILYDTFWAIGYPNAPNGQSTVYNQRWIPQTSFLVADFLGVIAFGIVVYIFYRPRFRSEKPAGTLMAQQQRTEAEMSLLSSPQGF